MPTYEFTIVVALPEGAPAIDAYLPGDFVKLCKRAASDSATGILTLEFSREAYSEAWAIRTAVDDIVEQIRKVHQDIEDFPGTYFFDILVEGVKIGGGEFEIEWDCQLH